MATTELIYPVPLPDGCVATLRLPINLRKDDAEKIARVVISLIGNIDYEIKDEDHRVT